MKTKRFVGGIVAILILLASPLTINIISVLTGDEAIGGYGVFLNAIMV